MTARFNPVDLQKANGVLIDNVFAGLWREISIKTVLSRAGFNKRSGTPMSEAIFGLMVRLRLKKESIGMFTRDFGDAVAKVMHVIDAYLECWFLHVLQLDVRTLRLEALESNDEQQLCR
jgi:hypothetical protein